MTIKPYLTLTRPANVVTAVADILAGASLIGSIWYSLEEGLLYLVLATAGLYGGGVVFNDVFDYELDKIERPERPLPSGRVKLGQAVWLGVSLLSVGVLSAFWVSPLSGVIAALTALFALSYDKYAKHHTLLGPLNMGLCRSLNLLLGMSLSTEMLFSFWYIAIIPLIFVADITLTSQGEVKGSKPSKLFAALFLDLVVLLFLIMLASISPYELGRAFPFLLIWILMSMLPKFRAIRQNEPKVIQRAVKLGVLSLIPLNASFAAGFASWEMGLIVLALLPVSIALARYFSVT